MADQRRMATNDPDYSDMPGRDREEIRDETEEDDEEFDETDDLDEEDDDVDLGKNVRDAERIAAANRGFTAGEATTTGGQPTEELRFDHRRDRGE